MKSIFAKYITMFAVIILTSFLMLSSIIAVSIDDYANNARMDDVRLITRITAGIVDAKYQEMPTNEVESARLALVLERMSPYAADISFLITDMNGNVIAEYMAGSEKEMPTQISAEVMNRLSEKKELTEYGKLNGTFSDAHFVCGTYYHNHGGRIQGAVFAFSSVTGADALITVMNKSILLANLWIMLAVMIAVYFITERLLRPLRQMRQAAKDFSEGKFDTRIQVVGNDEISEFAVTFNNMADSLAQLETLRSSFLANVSHDLRTPMTTIAGYIDGMLSGAIPEEKQTYYLTIVSGEVRRLSRLVSQLLDLSRMEAGIQKFNFTDFDVCEVARLILISFESKIDEKRLDVAFECDEERMMVHADRDAIHQVLYNICDNAIKFSREGGKLRLSVTAAERGKYRISVYNEGSGVAKEDLPYLFDRFFKSDKSRGLDKVGVGLGLYICKSVLAAHGESIRAESEEGKYCEFIFSLKRA